MRLFGRDLTLRKVIAFVAFALAAAALLWPIQYKAAMGADVNGLRNQFTLTSFSTQTCPWHLQLGHMPSSIPPAPAPNSTTSEYLIDSYNVGTCSAKRYDRTSEALLLLLIGFGLTVSGLRHRGRTAVSPSRIVATTT